MCVEGCSVSGRGAPGGGTEHTKALRWDRSTLRLGRGFPVGSFGAGQVLGGEEDGEAEERQAVGSHGRLCSELKQLSAACLEVSFLQSLKQCERRLFCSLAL